MIEKILPPIYSYIHEIYIFNYCITSIKTIVNKSLKRMNFKDNSRIEECIIAQGINNTKRDSSYITKFKQRFKGTNLFFW